ncbi:hypothetical protein [Bacillus safensis]|uniref:Uncharacterized protein n=1 Tax=Bacillus safensis TaxID=561879 RepID=A0A1L6ZPC9_BACIA|nr:hypothetical protein [Bacillus safensis]APT48370.1 hypothetical protein BSA145_21140 [Bacillus safensis]
MISKNGGKDRRNAITVYLSDRAYLAVDLASEALNVSKTQYITNHLNIHDRYFKEAERLLREKRFEEIRRDYKKRKQYKRRKVKRGWSQTIYLDDLSYVAVLVASTATKLTITSYISKVLRVEKEFLELADEMLEKDINIIFERKKN